MTRPPAKGFKEKAFVESLETMTAEKRPEAALTYLIDSLPGLQESGQNRKEKFKNLLFAPRLLQAAGLGKHGYRKLISKTAGLRRVLEKHDLAHRRVFVDFGAGAHEPLALSTFFYANGFERGIANDFLPLRNPSYSALSMYDILTNMQVFPERYMLPGTERDAFLERVGHFDLEAFERGDFEGGVAPLEDVVAFRACDIVEAGIAPGSVSFLVSFAVFEHVMDMEGVTSYLYDIMAPGGLGFHYIDLADHRAYRHDGVYNEFTFLTEEEAAPNLNRLRRSEQLAAFERAGFEILEARGTRIPIPEETRARFLPRWAEMSEEDQDTRSLHLTIRKPERA